MFHDELPWNLEITCEEEKEYKQVDYTKYTYDNFYGVYYGQLSLKVKPDTIKYLTNDITDNAIVRDTESKLNTVYETSSLGAMDSYDVYLSGASPLIEITNNSSQGLDDSQNSLVSNEYATELTYGDYIRINMSKFKEDMQIVMNGEFIPIPQQGIGENFYGHLVNFQLNQRMYPNFKFDKVYYGRYAWFDTENTCSDWNGFTFSSDVIDFSPISIKEKEQVDIYDGGNLTSETTINYLNGNIQKYILQNSL